MSNIWQRITLQPEKKLHEEKLARLREIYGEIVLLFPNDTKVKITGDTRIIKQIVNRLDGLEVEAINDLEELL